MLYSYGKNKGPNIRIPKYQSSEHTSTEHVTLNKSETQYPCLSNEDNDTCPAETKMCSEDQIQTIIRAP